MMIDKLTLEHLFAYAAYNINVLLESPNFMCEDKIKKIVGRLAINMEDESVCVYASDGDIYLSEYTCIKLILRPLSDLTKEIEHNGEKFVPINELEKLCECDNDGDWIEYFHDYYPQEVEWEFAPYWMVKKLFEWHFDLNGLIESGLAIDINTIK